MAGPASIGPGQVLCEDGAAWLAVKHPDRAQQGRVLAEVVANLLHTYHCHMQDKWHSLREGPHLSSFMSW